MAKWKRQIKYQPPSFLGITPKQQMCKLLNAGAWKGPATLPKETSFARYLSMIAGCSADGQLFLADLRVMVLE